MVPEFSSCIVCEGVREEARGKLTILGFFGIAPNVDVRVQHLDQPTGLCFIALGSPGEGKFTASFDVVDTSDGRKIAETPAGAFVASPENRTMAVLTAPLLFGRESTYALRFFLDGELKLEAKFDVRAANRANVGG